jgi:hypothetical protein
MVSVADILVDGRLPGNYFASDLYVRGSTELGLLENRRGDRLLAIPNPMLQAIYAGLDKETGQASKMVLYNCGRWWGKNFYARFCEELNDYHNQPVANLSMAEFLLSLQQCWKTHGWGRSSSTPPTVIRDFCVLKPGIHPLLPLPPKPKHPRVI